MDLIISIWIGIVVLEYFAFLILEMFLWTKKTGRRIFSNTKEKAEITKTLASNQGLYNGFLSAGLFGDFYIPNQAYQKKFLVSFDHV